MPKKINHAGEMQNYVPKGNGEYSGEYGDDITGSNVHYKVQDNDNGGIAVVANKPKSQRAKKKEFDEGLKKGFEEGQAKPKASKVQEAISKNFPSNIRDVLQRDYDGADEKAKSIVERLDVSIRTVDDFKKNIPDSVDPDTARKLRKQARGSFYMDDIEGYKHNVCFDDSTGRGARKGTLFHELGHAVDYQLGENGEYVSMGHRLKNGKTFWETLESECREGGLNQALKDYEKEQIDIITGGFSDMTERLNGLIVKYSDISDILDGYSRGRKNMNSLHGASYWRENPARRPKEAFAEIFSARSSNEESYKLFKKYLPKTTEAFEEIYQGLYEGNK